MDALEFEGWVGVGACNMGWCGLVWPGMRDNSACRRTCCAYSAGTHSHPNHSQRRLALLTCAQVAVKGIVLRTFGAGNAPDNNPDFLAALKEAHDMGIVIINTTQCMRKCVRNSCVAQIMSLTVLWGA